MASASFDVNLSVEECFERIQQMIGNAGFEITSINPNKSIIAEKGRDFKWRWIILAVIFFWPLAIIYYFTRPKNTINVTLESKNGACKVMITSTGRKGEELMNMIKTSLT